MSWNMTSKTANTNSDKSQAKFAKDPEDSQTLCNECANLHGHEVTYEVIFQNNVTLSGLYLFYCHI